MAEELTWKAVEEALQPILHLETELDQNKLEKRVRDYFRKGTKTLDFTKKPWFDLVNEYADAVFSALFNGLGDKPWLRQVDFLLCLDAGVKDNFPKQILMRVSQAEFEQVVLAAHDRSYEEQRVAPIMWEVVQSMVEGPKGKKKVYNSLETGFKEARIPSGFFPNEVQDFVGQWIDRTIAHLSEVSQGEPQYVLEPDAAITLFHNLLESGCVPSALVDSYGPPPPGWPFVKYCMQQSYAAHVVTNDGSVFGKAAGKRKGVSTKVVGKGASRPARPPHPLLEDVPPNSCRDFLISSCSRENCRFEHDDMVRAEVDLKRALAEADAEAEEFEAEPAKKRAKVDEDEL